jgi:hypothetical protein
LSFGGGTDHFDVLLHACVADPSRVFPVSKVLAFSEVAGDCALFFKWLFEEGVADAELAKNTLVVNASVCDHPETNVCHGMI